MKIYKKKQKITVNGEKKWKEKYGVAMNNSTYHNLCAWKGEILTNNLKISVYQYIIRQYTWITIDKSTRIKQYKHHKTKQQTTFWHEMLHPVINIPLKFGELFLAKLISLCLFVNWD